MFCETLREAGAVERINLKHLRVTSRPVGKSIGLCADQSIARGGFYMRRNDKEQLRRGHV